jgi:hypothetical protein
MIPEEYFKELDEELLEREFDAVRTLSYTKNFIKRLYVTKKNEVVLKMIEKKVLFADSEIKAALLREFKIAQAIGGSWPHLLAFFDFFYTKKHAVLVYSPSIFH